jgi:hypothetical protein
VPRQLFAVTSSRAQSQIASSALTAAAFAAAVEVDERAQACGQDEAGRLWDVLWMFRVAATKTHGDELTYSLIVRRSERTSRMLTLRAVIGPGDPVPTPGQCDGRPVTQHRSLHCVTIMLPDED